MSQPDPLQPPRTTDRAFELVRDALERYDDHPSARARLRDALDRLGACARHENVPPEAILVRLKITFDAVQGFSDTRSHIVKTRRSRIVAQAIDAYYLDRAAGS